MPVKYVGRITSFRGKRLFDILARLKGFGVGRMVYRHVFNERYPEPSFFVITKVEPLMSDPTEKDAGKVRAKAYGTKVWRGEQFGEACIVSGFKSDWRLVPRDEEKEWLDKAAATKPRPVPVAPAKDNWPPLLQYMMLQELKAAGKDESELPLMKLRKRYSKYNKCIYEDDLKTEAQTNA